LADQANAMVPELNAATDKYNGVYNTFQSKLDSYNSTISQFDADKAKLTQLQTDYEKQNVALTKETEALAAASKNIDAMPEPVQEAFAQLYKNGTTVYYSKLQLKKGIFTTPHLLADDKIVIKSSEIIAYQNEAHYAISQTLFVSGRKSFVSKETLPGFATRIVKGKLNVYSKPYFYGHGSVNEYFIQSNNDGKIYAYSPVQLKQLIQENETALNYFIEAASETETPNLIVQTADIFNNQSVVSSK
jgi:hypothetical protein